jgi:hypothetical protein
MCYFLSVVLKVCLLSVTALTGLDGITYRPQTIQPANGPYGIACADLDRDGKLDIIWGNDGKQGALDNTVSYVLNKGKQKSKSVWKKQNSFLLLCSSFKTE